MRLRTTNAALAALWILCCCSRSASAQTADDFFNPQILHELRIYMFPGDWAALKQNFLDNTYYPADFYWRFQNEVIEVQGVRVRSRGTGSRSSIKPGLRVDIDRDEPGREFLGLTSFILRNNTQDPSMLRERLSMLFFRRLGFPAPRTAHARMYVNDVYIGLYLIVEDINKAFLRRNFGEDGGFLYEYDYGVNDLPYYFEYRGPNPSLYSPKPFRPRTRELDPDAQPIEALVRAINLTSDAEFIAAVSEYVNLEDLMAYVAVERYLAEQDGMVGCWGMNNFYLYRLENRNISRIIPWDRSEAFKASPEESIWRFVTDVPPEQQNRLMQRAMTFPELRTIYLSMLARCAVVAGGENGFLLGEIEREYRQIREAAYEDVNKVEYDWPVSNEGFDGAVASLQDFTRRRKQSVLAEVEKYLEPAVERAFTIPDQGCVSWTTLGTTPFPVSGQGLLETSAGSPAASGLALFGFRQGDVLVTEVGLPATPGIAGGRIYAEVDANVRTSVVISNPNQESVSLSFYFTDLEGNDSGHGNHVIPARSQIARYLDQSPFSGVLPIRGSFTFSSSLPVTVLALRSISNERSEVIMTVIPVIELPSASTESVTLPYFIDGGGWTTDIVLVNPTDRILEGSLEFFGQEGTSVNVTAAYALPPRAAHVLAAPGDTNQVESGSVRISPASGSSAPAATAIVSHRPSGVLTTQASVPASGAGNAFRMYAEAFGQAGEIGSVETGVVLSNPGAETIVAELKLAGLSGKSSSLRAIVTLPPGGQTTKFLGQIEEFMTLATPFRGILQITVQGDSGIVVAGLRRRVNERGEFILTTISPVANKASIPDRPPLFPFLVDGGGYTTQLVLFSSTDGEPAAGTLQLFSKEGAALPLIIW